MEPNDAHLHLNLNDYNNPEDVIDVLFLEAFVSGSLRHARQTKLPRVKPNATMLPARVRPLRLAITGKERSVLAAGEGWMLRARRWADDSGDISVLARTALLARQVLTDAAGRARAPIPVDPHKVPFGYWHISPRGPSRSESAVTVEPWADIRRNYTARTAEAGDQLMALAPDSLGGRLLLLHGPPGTGKTTMLRALSIAWRRWCRVDCVLDPERLFNDPAYLLAVGLAKDRSSTDESADDDRANDDSANDDSADDDSAAVIGGPWWRLLVLEDCDELIRPGAKSVSGQALARLLNVTDGLLGHGRRLLVAITTNEPLARLHPAVTRPGRCLAQIEVGRFTRAEALHWLGRDPGGIGEGASLAELYATENDSGAITSASTAASVGLYL
jgi:hypothetical protein